MTELEIVKLAQICLVHLERRGFSVGASSKFEALEAQMPELGKSLISPTMRLSENDFTSANAFWISLTIKDELVGVMGMRLDDLGSDDVDTFWERAFERHYRNSPAVKIRLELPQVVRLVRGRIVYMGDLFFAPKIRGDRPNLMSFVHLAHCLCFLKWRHDWTYAFHRREDVLSGYSDRYGFNNRWPGAQMWVNPPDYRSAQEYLSVLSREEFEQKAAYYARNPDLLTQADPRAKSKEVPKS